MTIKELDKEYIAGTYNRFPIQIVSGKGSIVKDEAGKEYIDLGSGIAVTSFGVADDEWQKAVIEQIGKVQHTSNLYYTEPCAKLAEVLCKRTGMKKVFFSNSGAEANECAIKAARKYAMETKGSDVYTIVTLENSFHGRTLTTLSATGQDHYHELYTPLTPGFVSVPSGDIEAFKKAISTYKVAGVLMECIQGEGGVLPIDGEYIKEVEKISKENDIIVMIDEVQTGNGRTGELYAYMNYGINPDVVSTAKGLGGGLPIGATLLGEKVQSIFSYGDHGSTFGGNPVSCAAALSIINRIDDALLASVKEKSAYIRSELEGAKGIKCITGIGLMVGILPEKSSKDVVSYCMEHGVLVLTAKDKVRLLPALNIPFDVLKKAVAVIKDACAN